MISRRYRVQERRTTRSAVLLILLSIGLLFFLLFFGITTLAKFAAFVSDLQSSSKPVEQENKALAAPPTLDDLPTVAQTEQIKITGRAEVGSTLKVFVNSETVKETLVDDTGTYSLEITLSEGKNEVWVKTVDKNGHESGDSRHFKIIYDETPPTLEITKPGDGESFFGNNKNINVEGTTEAGARVMVNDRVAIVNGDGKFSQRISLSEGENIIKVVATDEAENTTEKEIKVTYTP